MMKSGTRLGPYEVDTSIGAGGMGEVYRARDTRLDRMVAVKVIPTEFAANAQLRLRFEREAKTISSLNHPHICRLYDVGEAQIETGLLRAEQPASTAGGALPSSSPSASISYLVMELLDGETLADRLRRGPLPIDQALRIAIEIASALDNAHRGGVIHRDLKPSNVMLTRSGAKLLDFGLAKPNEGYVPAQSYVSVDGVTHQKPLTEEGTILGTFQYMAPEQLEGAEADARTDIFAFGAVLYEMVTGSRAFNGKTRTSLIAAIVDREPAPISSLQPLTPPALQRIIKFSLQKDPEERWQTAHDLLLQLRWVEEAGSEAGLAAPLAARRRQRERFAWLLHLLTAAAAVGITVGVITSRREPPRLVQLSVTAPPKAQFRFVVGAMALSPDGTRIAFLAQKEGETTTSLWVRSLSATSAQPLAGTEDGTHPFWSPDSRHLAFFANGKLKKIDANGGPAQTLCEAASGRGGSWSSEGVIAFTSDMNREVSVVSDAGGVPRPLTKLRPKERSHRYPFFLPDGKKLIYLVERAASMGQVHQIRLTSLDGSLTTDLVTASSNAKYANGFLLYVRDRALVAQKLDPASGIVSPDLTPLAEGLPPSSRYEAAFSVSAAGHLAFVSGDTTPASQMVLADASGKVLQPIGKPGDVRNPVLSNAGDRLVVVAADAAQKLDLWVMDLERGTSTRLTFGAGSEFAPVWSPDDERIIFTSEESGGGDIVMKSSAGTGSERLLYSNDQLKIATDWSRDGNLVAFQEVTSATGVDLWLYSTRERKAKLFLRTPHLEAGGRISPDSRWISYSSNESGKSQVYVQALSGSGGKWQISVDGGSMAMWSSNGKQLYYVNDTKLLSVDVTADHERFRASVPRELFTAPMRPPPGRAAVPTRDGNFILNLLAEEQKAEAMTLVQNWPEMLKRK